jgi:hypothetical protein
MDPQKGPKPSATPAGVNRIDMAEEGPGMARANPDAAIENDQPAAFGEPGEVAAPDRDGTPVPGEDGGGASR